MNTVTPRRNRSTYNTDRGPSPNIWADCPVKDILEDPGLGVHIYDDFIRAGGLIATPTITTQADFSPGYKAFGSAGGTILGAALANGGGGLVFTETDDNQGLSLATIALPFKLDIGQGKFWFEARLKIGTVTDNDSGFFLGLLDSATLSATVPIAADGTLADENLVGFHRLEGDGDQIDTVYKANGVTQVSVATDVLSSTNTAAGALAADTYIKLGMKFESSNNTLYFYVNNLQLADSKAMPSGDGTDFPNDVYMGLVLAMLCGSNNDSILTLDWWRAAQLTAP